MLETVILYVVVFQRSILNQFATIYDLIDNMNKLIYHNYITSHMYNGKIVDTWSMLPQT